MARRIISSTWPSAICLGGIALQTVVLVLLDLFGLGKQAPLTYRAASLLLVLEGAFVVAVLTTVVMGAQLPKPLEFARMGAGRTAHRSLVDGRVMADRQSAHRPALAE